LRSLVSSAVSKVLPEANETLKYYQNQKRKKNFRELNCIALIIAFLPKICELFTTAFQVQALSF
jgi:hypothetical protein